MPLIQPNRDPSRTLSSDEGGFGLREIYLALLRLVLTVPLFAYQLSEQVAYAWGFVWAREGWPLLDAIRAMGLPQPEVTAVAAIFVLTVCPAAIALGFLARLNAALTGLALLFFFFSTLPLSPFLNGQTYVLYLGICAVLVLGGSGNLSLDGLFAARRRKKKRLREDADL